MAYIYLANAEQGDNESAKAAIDSLLKKESLKPKAFIEDEQANRIDWKLRALASMIKNMKKGETLITFEALNLARSTSQLLEIVELLAKKGLNLRILKHDRTFSTADLIDTKTFLSFLEEAENDYEERRNSEPFEKRTLSGVPLGRPKGRKNKSRKLDKHLPEIKKYLALKISKASIAKLIGCHAQTLYNYLEDKELLGDDESFSN